MPGYLLHTAAIVLCAHGGKAQPGMTNSRVRVAGQPVVTQPTPYVIAGCPKHPPDGPCISAHWVTAAMRVKAAGQPVLLANSQAVCVPTGQPLTVVTTQQRVKGM
jgi:hypothetical protein